MGYTVTVNLDSHCTVGFGDWLSPVYPISRTPPYIFSTSDPGGYAQFILTPVSGYRIKTYSEDGVPRIVSNNTQWQASFFYNTQNHTIDITTEPDVYTLQASCGLHGSITYSGTTVVPMNQTLVLNFTPDLGCRVSSVMYNGVEKGSLSVFVPDHTNATLVVTFELLPVSTRSFTCGPNGHLEVGYFSGGAQVPLPIVNGQVSFPYGTTAIYWNSIADPGYVFYNMALNGVDYGNNSVGYGVESLVTSGYALSTITTSVHVNFGTKYGSINASAGSHGTISPSGISQISNGQTITYNMIADIGYTIKSILINDVLQTSLSGAYAFSLNTKSPIVPPSEFVKTLIVTFQRATYNVTSIVGPNGWAAIYGDGNPEDPFGLSTFATGSNVVYTFSPNNGYAIENMIVDGVSLGPITSYSWASIQGDHTISVTFTSSSRTITVLSPNNGTITPSGVQSITIGQSKTFSIQANSGFQIENVLVDDVSVGAVTSYTFSNVQANHTISATMKILDSFVIDATSGLHGTITPGGSVIAVRGSNKSFSIVPDVQYHVQDVLVDGVSVGTVTSYTFTNVQATHTISVTFAIDSFTIQALAGSHGSIIPSGEIVVPYGGTQSFVITPDEDYRIQDVIVDGVIMEIPASGILFID